MVRCAEGIATSGNSSSGVSAWGGAWLELSSAVATTAGSPEDDGAVAVEKLSASSSLASVVGGGGEDDAASGGSASGEGLATVGCTVCSFRLLARAGCSVAG